jgi:hypothetical protein
MPEGTQTAHALRYGFSALLQVLGSAAWQGRADGIRRAFRR